MISQSDLSKLSSYLYLRQLKAFSQLIKPWAVGSYARIQPETNTLYFYSAVEKLEEVKTNIEAILMVSYLKLGCNSISLWCGLDARGLASATLTHHGVYNISTTQLLGNMVSTLHNSNSTKVVSSSNWVSFQTVAEALNVSQSEVEKTIEDNSIPVLRRQGEWGLSQDSAQELIQSHYQLQLSEAMARVGIEPSFTTQLVVDMPSTLETEQAEAKLLPPLQQEESLTALSNPAPSMTLPEDYSVKGGRTRNPVPSAALKEALAALPNAGVNKQMYLERIMLKKADAMVFLSQIASQYNKSEETLEKLRQEATKLWDSMSNE